VARAGPEEISQYAGTGPLLKLTMTLTPRIRADHDVTFMIDGHLAAD
jgi:hypothetical protein